MGDGREIKVRERELPRPWLWPEDVERFFDRMERGGWPRLWPARWRRPLLLRDNEWSPDIDVFEREGKIIVRADLPGMKREDIDVAIEGDILVIRGTRKEERETKEENYYCAERISGAFCRTIGLPDGVKADVIEATYENGVLEVAVPRPEAATPRRVKIQGK